VVVAPLAGFAVGDGDEADVEALPHPQVAVGVVGGEFFALPVLVGDGGGVVRDGHVLGSLVSRASMVAQGWGMNAIHSSVRGPVRRRTRAFTAPGLPEVLNGRVEGHDALLGVCVCVDRDLEGFDGHAPGAAQDFDVLGDLVLREGPFEGDPDPQFGDVRHVCRHRGVLAGAFGFLLPGRSELLHRGQALLEGVGGAGAGFGLLSALEGVGELDAQVWGVGGLGDEAFVFGECGCFGVGGLRRLEVPVRFLSRLGLAHGLVLSAAGRT
jgi:hypothetical protein